MCTPRSGVEDGTHPGDCFNTGFAPGCVPNPPTHNHIFLCGGVAEWMYRSLGGISPLLPGYASVQVINCAGWMDYIDYIDCIDFWHRLC